MPEPPERVAAPTWALSRFNTLGAALLADVSLLPFLETQAAAASS